MIPDGLQLATLCRDLAANKKAQDPVVLDLRKIGGPSDFFVIVSAENEPQLKAIAGEIERGVEAEGRHISFDGSSGQPVDDLGLRGRISAYHALNP